MQEKKAKQLIVQKNKNAFFIFFVFDLINMRLKGTGDQSKGRMRGQHSKAMVSREFSKKHASSILRSESMPITVAHLLHDCHK